MATIYEVGGFSGTKKVGEVTHDVHVGTMRIKSDGSLDLIVTGDGVQTVFNMLRVAAQGLADQEAPVEPGPEWNEMLRVPLEGSVVTITFGVRTDYNEPRS